MKSNSFATAITAIKSIWQPPSAAVLAAKEYEDAQRQLLIAQREHAYTGKLVEFYQMRIKALTTRETSPQYVER